MRPISNHYHVLKRRRGLRQASERRKLPVDLVQLQRQPDLPCFAVFNGALQRSQFGAQSSVLALEFLRVHGDPSSRSAFWARRQEVSRTGASWRHHLTEGTTDLQVARRNWLTVSAIRCRCAMAESAPQSPSPRRAPRPPRRAQPAICLERLRSVKSRRTLGVVSVEMALDARGGKAFTQIGNRET